MDAAAPEVGTVIETDHEVRRYVRVEGKYSSMLRLAFGEYCWQVERKHASDECATCKYIKEEGFPPDEE